MSRVSMSRGFTSRFFTIRAAMLAVLTVAVCVPAVGFAQGLPQPPKALQPPPPPPVKPYAAVAVTPPGPFNDASFTAFRQTLAGIAQRKDRAALAKLVVPKGFFWMQDKDAADPKKSGVDNLASAIGLDDNGGSGWDVVASAASDPTASALPEHKDVYCTPAQPVFDIQALQSLLDQTGTSPFEWGFPISNGVEVRSAAQPNAAVTDKLGLYFVRVLADSPPPAANGQAFVHIALPSGKNGFVSADTLAPLMTDQMCYSKDAGGWKITGYIGGVPQQ